jgi:hypothetical protein
VYDLIVDRHADTCGKPAVALECRLGLLFVCQRFRDTVNLHCRHAFANDFAQFQQYLRDNAAGTFHSFDLTWALQTNHSLHSSKVHAIIPERRRN